MDAVNRQKIGVAACYLLLTVLVLVYLAPIAYMLVSSLKPDDQVLAQGISWLAFMPVDASLTNYYDVFNRVRFPRILCNSIFITSSIMAGGLLGQFPGRLRAGAAISGR